MQVVEDMEKSLERFFTADFLKIVDDEHINALVKVDKAIDSRGISVVAVCHCCIGILHLEITSRDEEHTAVRKLLPHGIAHRVHQVCLSHPRRSIQEKGVEGLSKDELKELRAEFCEVKLSKFNFLTELIYGYLFPQDNLEYTEENLNSIPDLMFEVFKNVFKKDVFDIETVVFKTEEEVKKFFLNKLEQDTSKEYKTTLALMEVPTKEEIYNKLTETGKGCRYTFCSLEISEWTDGVGVYLIGSGD